jgi:hypothetical protein
MRFSSPRLTEFAITDFGMSKNAFKRSGRQVKALRDRIQPM